MYADLFLWPTVVKRCAADDDFFSGERNSDCHRHIVICVQSFRVVNDVCVLELNLLHSLASSSVFLLDDLSFYWFERTVQHRSMTEVSSVDSMVAFTRPPNTLEEGIPLESVLRLNS